MKARRITVRGLAASAPLAENLTSKGKQRNRAVVIQLKDKDDKADDNDKTSNEQE